MFKMITNIQVKLNQPLSSNGEISENSKEEKIMDEKCIEET
jgi:hypothetical protein